MTKLLKDRQHAGQLLARHLAKYANRRDCLVVALPRGGVVVASEIAAALHLPLDICVVRKLGVPFQPELAMGAIASGGVRILNQPLIQRLKIKKWEIDLEAAAEEAELHRREDAYRQGRPMLDVRDKTVILVDDGVATGATLEAAIEALKRLGVAHIIIAVGVAPPYTLDHLAKLVKEVACALNPGELMSVGEWYHDFREVTDSEVCDLLTQCTAEHPLGTQP